ncbi:glycosyltransferase [Cohnella panacarvi]|uniref:glycosyltransferase n=1 Tax=Cohnella panacarvi TaxID=400776 RepID=UPI00047CADAD|nr:glycosyltransferase [Cohnella panacarvi]
MITAKPLLEGAKVYESESPVQDPVISVIMSTYCRGDNGLLERAIRSVLNQTFTAFEFIVVDDGSTDRTREIVMRYRNHDPRIVYIRNERNSGLPALRVNQGIMRAKGKYIAYQFDDDQWTDIALEALYREIVRQPRDCVVFGKGLFRNLKTQTEFYIGAALRYDELQLYNRIINNAVLHPKSLCYAYGAYDCHLAMRRTSDWDLWLRWAEKVPFVFVDQVISIAEAYHEKSLGSDYIYDPQLFRLCYAIDRSDRLRLDRIEDYALDNLDFLHDGAYREHVYRKQVLPWFEQRPEWASRRARYDTIPAKPMKYVLVTKDAYDATVVIMLKNYIRALDGSYRFVFVPESLLNADALRNIDIAVLCRTIEDRSAALLDLCKQSGIPIVYAIDDDLLLLHTVSPEYWRYAPGTPQHGNLIRQLSNADLVLCYSRSTAASVRPYNSRIIELDTNVAEKILNRQAESFDPPAAPFKIVMLGTKSRKEEIDWLWDELLGVSSEFKRGVEFHFWGYIPAQIGSIQESDVFAAEFSVSYEEYINRLSASRFDLLLCPLFDTPFKKGKCPIKWLEGTICGAVGLFSDVEPYESVQHGVNGFKVPNEKGRWAREIGRIIRMPTADRKRIRNRAVDCIRKRYTSEAQAGKFALAMESVSPPASPTEAERARAGLALTRIRNKLSYAIGMPNRPVRTLRCLFRCGGKRMSGLMRVTVRDEAGREIEAFDVELAGLSGDCSLAFPIPPMPVNGAPALHIEFRVSYDEGSGYLSVFERPVRYPFLRLIGRREGLYAEMGERE